MLTRLEGAEGPLPGHTSFTRVVPWDVPSVFQSSAPLTGSVAAKKTNPLAAAKDSGLPLVPGPMSLTR